MSVELRDRDMELHADELMEGDDSTAYEPDDYRALSSAAVAGVALSLLSIVAMFDWWLMVIPVAGIALSTYALRTIRQFPEEYTGLHLARAGLALSVLFIVLGGSRLTYVYATEVPEGFERINYDVLQPNPNVLSEAIPPSAMELSGKQVFIKGYAYPDGQTSDVRTFLLVRDKGDCCFGGNPKVTDRIQVTLKKSSPGALSNRLYKVAGLFRVQSGSAQAGLGDVFYHLDEAELR